MRWALALLILMHGLIHFMGVAKSFGLADLPQLTQPIPMRMGLAWLMAGLALLSAGVLLLAAPHVWWALGIPAAVLSQIVLFSAWSDARFGTVANLVVLAAALYGFASQGPLSLRAEYARAVERHPGSAAVESSITEADLSRLPDPVRRYLRKAGAVGQPRVSHFTARWTGRIRGSPDEAWMGFSAEQHNHIDPPARMFFMDARRSGLPVDVFHLFEAGGASMQVRLLSVVPMVRADGPDLTLAETVTLLNDLAILAPAALVHSRIRWEAVDDRSARASYAIGANTIRAVLSFNGEDELVDFVSEDRLRASPDGREFTPVRWSTPLSLYRQFGPLHVASRGEAWWHPRGADPFSYLEMELLGLEVNPPS